MEGQIQENFGRDIETITFADFFNYSNERVLSGWSWFLRIVVTRLCGM